MQEREEKLQDTVIIDLTGIEQDQNDTSVEIAPDGTINVSEDYDE